MLRRVISLLAIVSAWPTASLAEQSYTYVGKHVLASEIFISSDSDQFEIFKVRLGGSPNTTSWPDTWRVSVTRIAYREPNWRSFGEQLSLSYKNINADGTGLESHVHLGRVAGKDRLTMDHRWAFKVGLSSLAELLVTRDVVESRLGLLSGRSQWSLGAGIETQWLERFSTVAQVTKTQFSDDNDRDALKGKLIYDLLPIYGITAQLWHQNQRNSRIEASERSYFNPSSFQETLVVLSVRKRVASRMFRARLGHGMQHIEGVGGSQSQFADLVFEQSQRTSWHLRTTIGYKRSAGVNDPSYTYRYGMQEVVIPF